MTINFDVDAALAKLGELATQHGPQAVDLAAQVVQVDAAGGLVIGTACLLAAVIGGRKAIKVLRAGYDEEWGDGPLIVGGIVGCVVAALVGIFGAACLLDIWNWVGVFNPKLALAHEVFVKLARAAS